MTRGLVIGKFYPPHAGHYYLIDQASARCDHLTVLVMGNVAEGIPLEFRTMWVGQQFPDLDVKAVADHYPTNYVSEFLWQRHMELILQNLENNVDVVFSSESYGDELARRLGARHECIDSSRNAIKTSATDIRKNPFAHWKYLDENVRRYLAKRVIVLGAESTGTSTLAKDLAEHFNAPLVLEYGREYSERKTDTWEALDFQIIAGEQTHIEEAAAAASDVPLIICDTNALATVSFEQFYIGSIDPLTRAVGMGSKADLYICTYPDIPFVQDGGRDEHIDRLAMHEHMKGLVERTGAKHIEVRGDCQSRVATAIKAVDGLFSQGLALPDKLELVVNP